MSYGQCEKQLPGDGQCTPVCHATPEPGEPRDGLQIQTHIGSVAFHLHTLFLFTKSDLKTIVVPQSILAVAALLSGAQLTTSVTRDGVAGAAASTAPDPWLAVARLPHMLLWLWLNLLVENIADQRLADSIAEDNLDKPWRPLPSGRLTMGQARAALLAIIPLTLAVSANLGASAPSTALMVFVWMYADLGGSRISLFLRNALNGAGFACFGWGALAALAGPDVQLLPRGGWWIALTGAVVLTTIHVQDFRDMAGDRASGRRTVALLFSPWLARGSVAVMVLLWSAVCPVFWAVGLQTAAVPLALGLATSTLTLLQLGQKGDEFALTLWCLWVTSLYLLPLFASR